MFSDYTTARDASSSRPPATAETDADAATDSSQTKTDPETETTSSGDDSRPRTVILSGREAAAQGQSRDRGRGRGSRGRLRGAIDSLSARFDQQVETRSRSPSFRVRNSGVERNSPPKRLDEYRAIPNETPIVRKALTDFASDVVEPGYRIETDDEAIQDYLTDTWCPQAGIVAGEKHNDLLPILRQFIIERWRGGDALAEHVRADPDDATSLLTGLHLINPEHVAFITLDEKNILVDPDAPDHIDAPRTRRGEKAAYVQYSNDAIISTTRDAVPLSQNDVTRSALDAGAGELRGTPVTETIADDVAGYKNILRDKEQAIKTKAWGLWDIGFGRETLEYTDVDPETGNEVNVTDIIEWSQEDQNEYVTEHLDDINPGAILTHDGAIDLNRIEGEVPDLIADLEHYVSNIVSPLPTPLYIVGFETNINQFVTEKQDERYQHLINEEREELERVFTDLMTRVVERNLVENAHEGISVSAVPDDLRFRLSPPQDESPVLSLDMETIERMKTFAEAYSELRGDIPADMFGDPKTLLTLILQLPPEAVPDTIGEQFDLDESDPDLQQAAEEMDLDITSAVDGSESANTNDNEGDADTDGESADLFPPGIQADD
jgi:hypothetical protein